MAADAQDKEELRRRRREETLAQCRREAAAWAAQPGRNLVLLFDGTGNILGNEADTNVVKLLRMIRKQGPFGQAADQLVYYDPGVGTEAHDFPPDGLGAKLRGRLRQIEGLAFGRGAFDNLAQAYEFLCREWREGDRIWLFGFSRGAFTARSVAGMVNMYGLVPAAGLPLVRTLVRTYYAEGSPRRDAFARDVLEHFSLGRTPLVHFTGVWDTVETVGLAGGVKISNSARVAYKRFTHIRHALALHETRQKYRPREYADPQLTPAERAVRSFGQRWFRGVHSDVGGSYAEAGLSNIALNWMAREAAACGLALDPAEHPEDPGQPLHDQVLDSPYWVLTGLDARDRQAVAADVDASAQPIKGALPAQRSPQAWVARTLGIGLFLAMLVFGLFAVRANAAACSTADAPAWVKAFGWAWQLLAPWADRLGLRCDATAVARAIHRDWAFLAAYWLWLPYPLAWALRRWCRRAIDAGTPLPAFAARAHLGLWLLLAADLLENAGSLWWPHWPWAVMVASLAKWASLAWLLAVFCAGLAGGRDELDKPAGTVREADKGADRGRSARSG